MGSDAGPAVAPGIVWLCCGIGGGVDGPDDLAVVATGNRLSVCPATDSEFDRGSGGGGSDRADIGAVGK